MSELSPLAAQRQEIAVVLAGPEPERALPQVEALARTLLAANQQSQAIACYQAFLAACPKSADGWYNAALIYRACDAPEDALRAYDEALTLSVAEPEQVHSNRSIVLSELQRHEEAAAALEAALACNGRYEPALYNLALLKEEQGDWTAARTLYERLLRNAPGHAQALARLAHGQPWQGSTDGRALAARIENLLQRQRLAAVDREELLYARGKLADESGAYALAARCYEQGNRLSQRRAGRYDRAATDALCTALLKRDLEGLGDDAVVRPERLLFICGMFRSGSTLLEQMLSAHPALESAGELRYFERAAPLPQGLESLYGASATGVAEGYVNRLAARFPDNQPGSLLNKQPENLWYVGWLCQRFPDARVLITERSSADNALSVFMQPLSERYRYANALDDIAQFQRVANRLRETWIERYPAQVMSVAYEDVVMAPEATLTRVLAFLGLGWHEDCLRFFANRTRVRTASVAQVRQSLHGRSVGRSRNYPQWF